jgi:hypothetical protein
MENQNASPKPETPAELSCTDLLACPLPLCGGHATLSELRYANTGNIYGYTACCDECGLELSRQPAGWPCGYEKETMANAKSEVVTLWNTRHANADISRRTVEQE